MREGWKKDKLESIITQFIVPQRDRPKVFDGNVPWCRIEDFDGIYLSKSKSGLCVSQELIESMPLRVYPIGTVIVSCSADLGKCAIIAEPLITNQTFIGLVPSESIDSLYLYYLMGSMSDLLNSMASGATIKYLSKKKFQELEIPIPPLPEQKQIVTILDKAFAAIDQAKANIERNIENAKELFQSKLNEIFSQKGEGWEEKKLGDICENLDSKRIPITKNKRKSGSVPYYGASGIVDYVADYIFDEDLLLVSEDGANLLMRTYPIAFSITGKTWVNNHAHALRFSDSRSQNFIEYYLNSIKLDPYVSGMAQPKLNQKMLNSIKVPFPSLNTQGEIVDVLENLKINIDQSIKIYKNKIDVLQELKKSILQKAFTGELTANEDILEEIPLAAEPEQPYT